MKAMTLPAPGGLDRLAFAERADPGAPGPGEIRVALHGSSLNYPRSRRRHRPDADAPTAASRWPTAPAMVEAVGEGVTEFAVGDMVVSCFFPDWQDGTPTVGDFSRTPGDGIDGFAQEHVVLPATAFTHAPKGYDAVEAATITTAGLTAWRALVVDGRSRPGDTVLLLGTGGVSIWALQIAKAMGATGRDHLVVGREAGARHGARRRLHAQLSRATSDWGRDGARLDRRTRRRSRRRGRRAGHARPVDRGGPRRWAHLADRRADRRIAARSRPRR